MIWVHTALHPPANEYRIARTRYEEAIVAMSADGRKRGGRAHAHVKLLADTPNVLADKADPHPPLA